MYKVLLQKGKKALGVLPQTFKTQDEIDDHIDKHYPNHFIAKDFEGSERHKSWVAKHGHYKPNLKEETMIIESILNKKPKQFAKVFEDLMSDKVAQALTVLNITEGKKLLLGGKKKNHETDEKGESKKVKGYYPNSYFPGDKASHFKTKLKDGKLEKKSKYLTKEDEIEEGRYRGKTYKGYSANRKARRAQKTDNSPNADKLFYYNKKSSERFDKHLDKSHGEKEAAARTKNLTKFTREDENLDEAGLLLKQNSRGKRTGKAFDKAAVRGADSKTLKGIRVKQKYHGKEQADRFAKKAHAWNPKGKALLAKDEIRSKINARKAKDPKRLPEEEIEENRYQGKNNKTGEFEKSYGERNRKIRKADKQQGQISVPHAKMNYYVSKSREREVKSGLRK